MCNRLTQHHLVKVFDFGLVRDVTDFRTEEDKAVAGAPRYMSPESITSPEMEGALKAENWRHENESFFKEQMSAIKMDVLDKTIQVKV